MRTIRVSVQTPLESVMADHSHAMTSAGGDAGESHLRVRRKEPKPEHVGLMANLKILTTHTLTTDKSPS